MGILLSAMSESASQRAPQDDFWYTQVGSSIGGAPVSADTALRLSTVFACIRVLAETLSSLPLIVFRRTPKGGKERATEHPLYALLHDQPNHWQTSMEWREMMMVHCALRGNAYSEIISARGEPVAELIPLPPDSVTVELLPGKIMRYTLKEHNGTARIIPTSNMFHLRGMSLDGYVGISPIDYERETVSNGLAALQYQGRILKNDGAITTYLNYPGKFKDAENRAEFARQWQAAVTGGNRGKTPILENGMELHNLTVTNRELQYIESRKYTREEIAAIYRVPLVLLQAGDKTQTYASAEQFFDSLVKHTMLPWFYRWEQAISRDLIMPFDEDIFAEFLVDGLLRGDTAARSAFYQIMVEIGAMTRNEVRIKENLNPLPGLDEPVQQPNAGTPGQQPDSDIEPEQKPEGKPKPKPKTRATRKKKT